MATTKMSITRALSEVKMLDKRIRDAIIVFNPIAAYQKSKNINDYGTVENYNNAKKAELQSLYALVKRKNILECAICLSNANTYVTVQGQTYSVAQLVKLKNDYKDYMQLLTVRLQTLHTSTLKLLEQKNAEVESRLDNLLLNHFGKDTSKVSKDDLSAITAPFLAQNEYALLDPCSVAQLIVVCQKEEVAFSTELDYTLSESNSTTFIDIED